MIEPPPPQPPLRRSGLTAGLVMIAIGFGAIAAVPAVIFEGAGEIGLGAVGSGSPDVVTAIALVVMAPVIEEIVKPLGLYLVKTDQRPTLTLKEWAILGFLAGLSFSMLEHLLYIFIYTGPVYGADGMLAIALVRLPVPVHMICTSMTGFGIGMWYQSKRIEPFAITLGLAVLIHAFWNSMVFG